MLRLALFAGLVVMAAGAVADIPRTPGGNESELRQKVTIELPEQDASACRSNPISGPELVDIEGGHFWRGSLNGDDDEKPLHKITVHPFALGRCEVTVAEFSVFVEDTGYVATADSGDCRAINEEGSTFVDGVNASWRYPRYPEVAQVGAMPVVCVSFDDALAYTRWLTALTGRAYRLPTEAEWEYAARGTTTTARHWEVYRHVSQCDFANGADQDSKSRFEQQSNVECADGHVVSAPVATYRPNVYGLYDMLGNVWEWTADCWKGSYEEPPSNGEARLAKGIDCSRRVLRGGSWFYGPEGLRAAKRSKDYPAKTYNSVGFRIARTH